MKGKFLHCCGWLLLCFTLPVMAQVNVLQQKISINFRNEGITRCFSLLQAKGGVTFLLKDTGLEYEAVDDRNVVIRKIVVKAPAAAPANALFFCRYQLLLYQRHHRCEEDIFQINGTR